MKKQNAKIDLKNLADNWKSSYVARNKIGEFTGGMVTPGTMAVLDSKGEGPEEKFLINRKICYSVASVIEWLEGRAKAA